MEKQTGLLGLPKSIWVIVGMMGLASVALMLCALIILAFGVDIGGSM